MTEALQATQELVLITGPSGAGRSTAMHALEDLGFEVIDNLPLSLVPLVLAGPAKARPLAFVVDARNREFAPQALDRLVATLAADPRIHAELLYLDCAEAVLVRRFSETRRRHPLAASGTLQAGLSAELALLGDAKGRADHLIDTSEMTPHELRAEVTRRFDRHLTGQLVLSVQSFSYKRGVPAGLDMVLDCRFLANPHWRPELRGQDGRDGDVLAFVAADPRCAEFLAKTVDLLQFVLPAHLAEGKAYFSVGFGCTGGQHRSVAVAEAVGKALAEAGWAVSIRHGELERRSAANGGVPWQSRNSGP
jgi:RNase adapter protein RapZ